MVYHLLNISLNIISIAYIIYYIIYLFAIDTSFHILTFDLSIILTNVDCSSISHEE